VRLGVVGAGLVSQAVHLPWLREMDDRFALAGLAEPEAGTRRLVAARYGIPVSVPDHRRLIEQAPLDALLVCSPNPTHAGVVLDALEAGLHVLVEKPLCLSLEDADRIVQARDRTGLTVQVGYMKRFDPGYDALVSDLRTGAGRLLHLTTLTYDPGLSDWFAPPGVPAPGGGRDPFSDVVLGALVHDVNLVHGLLEALGRPLPQTVADAFVRADGAAAGATVVLEDGVRWTLAWLRLDGLADFRQRLAVYAEDGVLALEFPAPYLQRAPTVYTRARGGRDGHRVSELRSWHEAYARQLEHFHACVSAGAACRTPPETARADLALLAALAEPAR
jgi:predicted dehydrogenase